MKKSYLHTILKPYFKTLFLFACILFVNAMHSQVVLISPTGDGGFENGTTFPANGWTVANGGNANRNWYVGTGQTGYTGARCAFIGNNATTVGTNGSARVQHFYRSITIPAGATNIQLSFKYKQATLDYSGATYYDFVSVSTSNTAPTGNTAPPGAVVFGPYPNVAVPNFTTQNATLSNALAGTTTNLIFTFQCDNAAPDAYGAIDDISLVYTLTPTITSLGAASGCQGNPLTITGTNLSGATAVTIGGTAASITANTATAVTVTIGAGTTGTVSVTTPGGTATSAATFTVNPQPAVIAGGTATVCTGNSTPAFTNATAGGTWSITNGTGTASISAGGIVTAGNAGTVTAVYTLLSGCSRSTPLTIQQTPGAIGGGSATVCTGVSTPAFTNPNAGGTWTVTNGTGAGTITSPGGILTGTSAGTITVVYTIGSCTPATYPVTVHQNPAAIGGATTVCVGATATLTNASSGGTWSVTNGTGSASISPTGDLLGITDGTVTANYTIGICTVTRVITVTPPPGAIAGGSPTVCVGSSTPAFTNLNAGGTWSVINGTGSATITTGGVATGVSAGTVTVVYTIGSCTPSTIPLTVNPLPAAIAGSATVCTGTTTTMTNTTAGGTWSITNGTGSATISALGVVTPVTVGGVTVVYTLPTSCNITRSLTVQQTPGAIAGGSSTVCVGASTPAFTNPNAGGTWSVSNGTGSGTITAGGVLSGVTAGSVTVNYTIGSCVPSTYAVNVLAAPAAPTAPVNSNITNSGFTVSWTASAGAVNYVLEVYTNAAMTIAAPGSPFTIASPTVTYTVGGLNPYTTYYYRIRATNANCSSTYVNGSVTTLTINDNCTGAISMTVNPSPNCSAFTSSTTVGATQSMASCSGFSDDDVWFSFVATGTSHIVTVAPLGLNNAVFEVFNGTCTGLTSRICVNDTAGANLETTTLTGLAIGTTYYVRVYSSRINIGDQGTFNICVSSPITNDDCTGAIPLTVSNTCSYSTYTNAGATNTTSVADPGCGGYAGGDVWFSLAVPVTGEITVDLQAGDITDSGMAIYSGTCGGLTLLECNDDKGAFAFMSNINLRGLTPGQTIYIRIWSYDNEESGTFGICATTPACPSPSDLNASVISTTSVTVSWNPTTPSPSGGYQYFINTTGTAPTAGSTPTGTTAAGVFSVTLSGLTPGLKYYFWVRSNCGGSGSSTWFGPTNYTPCAIGNGTGSTTVSCINPTATGSLSSVSLGTEPLINCSAGCPTLEMSYLQLKQTTDYVATEIPYAPPYQFTCLQNPVSVNIDDRWSPAINLPFNFCFYGNNYNRCLMGSNGVLTFDTVNNAPGGYSDWQFNTNLPSTNLFRNTIFGVYHDIDPSKGGQVGWELITLNSGCRALVASWSDIPMFSSACSNMYYTGMIVLYENSNVIEVYVKEKNICASWNRGNAIVGIQNGAGTMASFPTTPTSSINTNNVASDWTATNKAWRFTPNGANITPTFQWYQGPPIAANQITGATSSTLSVCPAVSTSYTAEVTYPLCTGTVKVSDEITVTVDGNKVWNGSTDTNWNVASNWTPNGVPVNTNCVIIPNTTRKPVISSAPDAVGYNLAVYNNAQLTINSNQNLTITDRVTVQPNGIFTINNSASLIQINNILNSGNIIYKRDSPNIRMLDYSYWSSPVAGFNVSNIVSPLTFGPIYRWNTTLANPNGGQGGWQGAAGSIMVAGKGYIARAPNAAPYNSGSGTLNGTFTGIPNNGIITIPIERGNDQNTAYHTGTNGIEVTNLSDNWNLVGNPYPSAIRGSQFLYDNRTKILGNIRLWTHGTLPSELIANPFYSSFVYNYTAGDYYTYNFTGTSCCPAAGADLFVGSGQGFFVQMIDGAPVSAADNITVEFNNGLRSAAFSNSSFYRTANVTTTSTFDINSIERNRIWLDIINPNGQSDRTLFGYIQDATMETDSFFDCITQNTGGTLIYSETGDTKFNIQGRSLPFDVNDQVAIGINTPNAGEYTIAIAGIDGLFTSQNIYLKDELLNITHDLKAHPYRFNSAPQAGGINNRFKVVYVNGTLGNPSQTFDNTIKVIVNTAVAVSSNNLEMESIEVYTLLGQKLDTYKNINSNHQILYNLHKNHATLLLKIKLQTGESVIKKIIY